MALGVVSPHAANLAGNSLSVTGGRLERRAVWYGVDAYEQQPVAIAVNPRLMSPATRIGRIPEGLQSWAVLHG